MHQKIQHEPTILRRRHVEQRTGLSRSTLYQYMKDGVFPKPVQRWGEVGLNMRLRGTLANCLTSE